MEEHIAGVTDIETRGTKSGEVRDGRIRATGE
jgi:hypothetical protein